MCTYSQTSWKMALTASHQRSILKIQKPVEVLIWTCNYLLLSKYLNSISRPSPFKETLE